MIVYTNTHGIPNIICSKNKKHIMEYRDNGEKGEGYYCLDCSEVETEKQLQEADPELREAWIQDQLHRKILR